MHNIPDLIAKLKAKGYRSTIIRKHILNILATSEKPLAVADIQASLKKRLVSAHFTTIYRELALLCTEGIVKAIQLGENKKLYELFPEDHHHHLICVSCEKIENIVLENDLNETEKMIARTKHFKVLDHSLEFFGTCINCVKS